MVERDAGAHRVDRRVVCGLDDVVDRLLRTAEAPSCRVGARDVGRVEIVAFDRGVDEHDVAVAHGPVVVVPVEDARVRPRTDDRPVAGPVAGGGAATQERALEPALAAVGDGPRDLCFQLRVREQRRCRGAAERLAISNSSFTIRIRATALRHLVVRRALGQLGRPVRSAGARATRSVPQGRTVPAAGRPTVGCVTRP